jgi:hypothetical protein
MALYSKCSSRRRTTSVDVVDADPRLRAREREDGGKLRSVVGIAVPTAAVHVARCVAYRVMVVISLYLWLTWPPVGRSAKSGWHPVTVPSVGVSLGVSTPASFPPPPTHEPA